MEEKNKHNAAVTICSIFSDQPFFVAFVSRPSRGHPGHSPVVSQRHCPANLQWKSHNRVSWWTEYIRKQARRRRRRRNWFWRDSGLWGNASGTKSWHVPLMEVCAVQGTKDRAAKLRHKFDFKTYDRSNQQILCKLGPEPWGAACSNSNRFRVTATALHRCLADRKCKTFPWHLVVISVIALLNWTARHMAKKQNFTSPGLFDSTITIWLKLFIFTNKSMYRMSKMNMDDPEENKLRLFPSSFVIIFYFSRVARDLW